MARKKVPNLTWRQVGAGTARHHLGRWNPGPALRGHGFRAIDLWGQPGRAMTPDDWQDIGFDEPVSADIRAKVLPLHANRPLPVAEAEKAARALNRAAHGIIAERKADRPPPSPSERSTAARIGATRLTVNHLLDTFLNAKQGEVAPNTFANYRTSLFPVRDWIGDDVPAIVTKDLLVDRFWKWKAARGHHGAHRSIASFCTALTWAHGREPFVGAIMPEIAAYTKLGLPSPPARLRVALPSEIEALLLAFDDPAAVYDRLDTPAADRVLTPRPSLGDGLVSMIWSCARVGDALGFGDQHLVEQPEGTMVLFRPAKQNHGDRRKLVAVPLLPIWRQRVEQARDRRAQLGIVRPEWIVDEELRRPYLRTGKTGVVSHTRFTAKWNEYRDLAGRLCPSLVGEGTNPIGDPWLPFNAQDCRDTGVTRLWEATRDLSKVALYHGSSPDQLAKLARHYIQINPFLSFDAGADLERWANTNGILA